MSQIPWWSAVLPVLPWSCSRLPAQGKLPGSIIFNEPGGAKPLQMGLAVRAKRALIGQAAAIISPPRGGP